LKEPFNPHPIETNLDEFRRKIKYPQATDTQEDKYYNELLWEDNISSWNVPSDEEGTERSKIRSQLEEVDRKTVNNVVECICEQAHTSISSTARSYVKAWLDGRYDGAKQLARFIANGRTAHDHSIMRPIEQLGIRIRENEDKYDAMSELNDIF
jgi:hypothetical protein